MRCPYCQMDKDKVVDSRDSDGGRVVRRRRECLSCGKRFTTHEKIEAGLNLTVVKKDGTRAPFDRAKLLGGLHKACYKRKVSEAQIEAMADAVEEELLRRGEKEVATTDIGMLVVDRLKLVDHVAFLRFASVYLNPDRVDVLLDELRRAREEARSRPLPGQQQLF